MDGCPHGPNGTCGSNACPSRSTSQNRGSSSFFIVHSPGAERSSGSANAATNLCRSPRTMTGGLNDGDGTGSPDRTCTILNGHSANSTQARSGNRPGEPERGEPHIRESTGAEVASSGFAAQPAPPTPTSSVTISAPGRPHIIAPTGLDAVSALTRRTCDQFRPDRCVPSEQPTKQPSRRTTTDIHGCSTRTTTMWTAGPLRTRNAQVSKLDRGAAVQQRSTATDRAERDLSRPPRAV